jgi:hypothetical protein
MSAWRASSPPSSTGIGRNEQVELVYPNGEIVLITKARKRGEKEGGE